MGQPALVLKTCMIISAMAQHFVTTFKIVQKSLITDEAINI